MAVILCLSLAACGSRQDRAIKIVDKLLKNGKYDDAIEMIEMMQLDAELNGMDYDNDSDEEDAPREEEEAPAEQPQYEAAYYCGTWRDLENKYTLEILEDGTSTYTDYSHDEPSVTDGVEVSVAVYNEGEVHINAANSYLTYYNLDGVELLSDGYRHYLREADYNQYVEVIEITEENWQDYFEIRMAHEKHYDKYGDLSDHYLSYGFFLQDAYLNRYYGGDATVEFTYYNVEHRIDGDPSEMEELELGEVRNVNDYLFTVETYLTDYRDDKDTEEKISDYNGTVSCQLNSGYGLGINNRWTLTIGEDYEFSRSVGSLILVDERLSSFLMEQ